MNPMREIRIEKLTLNVGAGTDQEKLKKGMKLLKNITGIEPVKTITDKRIPGWGVRPGLPIGCKITIRREHARELLKRLLKAKDNRLPPGAFDSNGNVAFGIHEYIDIPGLEYDSAIGIIGFQVTITLSRPGHRVKYRKKLNRKLGKSHHITQQDSMDYFKKEFNVTTEEE
ncbi:TPA: 50S ribosomal protein L5 [Candidatus Woesearchaeota archaeon]|nr:50S ribosomal protein L5 [archaeon GW2011_AR15]AJS11585.1 50S ribosomal protein L5P [uncultured archaeon]AJS11873.1 50S ribosomal protein L5P [uncultured archaeon]MBS3103852.1 50S ribosomal protein L5 [Candidatus Woesearchaeota archaeon]HIH40822.1 50S ribosomal protein L5 [Candidatus Woesearchaeota archaeon]